MILFSFRNPFLNPFLNPENLHPFADLFRGTVCRTAYLFHSAVCCTAFFTVVMIAGEISVSL